MLLKKEFIGLDKSFLYDNYTRIIYRFKNYDNITRGKMLDEIIRYYNEEDFPILDICTVREIHFLQKFMDKKLSTKDIKKYKWEIKELNNKCIFSNITYEVFDEFKDVVKRMMEKFDEGLFTKRDDVLLPLIAIVKSHGSMVSKVLATLGAAAYGVTEEKIEELFYTSLFRYYCYYTKEYFEESGITHDILIYQDYYLYTDKLNFARKQYGTAASHPFQYEELLNIFYYGYDISNPKIKKMYDIIDDDKHFVLSLIVNDIKLYNTDRNHLHDYLKLKNLEKYIKIFDEALDNIPCAAMNAITPLEYQNNQIEAEELQAEIVLKKQTDACLSNTKAKLYYKLYFALLEYTNRKYKINSITKIYGKLGLDGGQLVPIDNYLWEHKDSIIDEFIKINPYRFNKKELEILEKFKNSIHGTFVLYGFEEEYTIFLSEDGKSYMVKGINSNIDEIVEGECIPQVVETTLIPFENVIIYSSLFSSYPIHFDNGFKKMVINDYNSSIKYYHL